MLARNANFRQIRTFAEVTIIKIARERLHRSKSAVDEYAYQGIIVCLTIHYILLNISGISDSRILANIFGATVWALSHLKIKTF